MTSTRRKSKNRPNTDTETQTEANSTKPLKRKTSYKYLILCDGKRVLVCRGAFICVYGTTEKNSCKTM